MSHHGRGLLFEWLTSCVLISCWVISALVAHWVLSPSNLSADTSITGCTTSRVRRISCSASSSAITAFSPVSTLSQTNNTLNYSRNNASHNALQTASSQNTPIYTHSKRTFLLYNIQPFWYISNISITSVNLTRPIP